MTYNFALRTQSHFLKKKICFIPSVQFVLAEVFKFDHDLSILIEYENRDTPQVVLEMGNASAGKKQMITL